MDKKKEAFIDRLEDIREDLIKEYEPRAVASVLLSLDETLGFLNKVKED